MKKILIFLLVFAEIVGFCALLNLTFPKKEENPLEGQNVLVIGDSLTAAGEWQRILSRDLGMNVTTRAKGGFSYKQMVDGELGLDGDYATNTAAVKPLSVDEVKDKDFIILYGGYNNRSRLAGTVGDRYKTDGSGQGTFAGFMQYAIDRIRETLEAAGNKDCEILIVTMHCAGRYAWIDASAYEEYPVGSGQTMETLANMQVAVAKANNLEYVDLFHDCSISPLTWDYYSKSASPVVTKYSPYLLDKNGDPVSSERMTYVPGEWYYQTSSGKVLYKQYDGTTPHPYNGDQLHLNTRGYLLVGETIANRIKELYGK